MRSYGAYRRLCALVWLCLPCVLTSEPAWTANTAGHTSAKTARFVCPDSFAVNYDTRDHTQPFWLPKLELLERITSSKPELPYDITLAVATSLERLQAQELQCLHWRGTVAVALYLASLNGTDIVVFATEDLPQYTRQLLDGHTTLVGVLQRLQHWAKRVQAHEHSCRFELSIYLETIPALTQWWSYPVNAMRNRALAMVKTEVMLAVDADFCPGPAQWLQQLFQGQQEWAQLMGMLDDNTVVVAHALDVYTMLPLAVQHDQVLSALRNGTKQYVVDHMVPNAPAGVQETAEEAHLRALSGIFLPFQPCCHALTNHSTWLTSTTPYSIAYESRDGFAAAQYEPYVFGRTHSLPYYDERYRGYSFNKMSYIWHLFAAGFSFMVHPDMYLMHLPHSRSNGTFALDWKYPALLESLYYYITPGIAREGWGLPPPYIASCDESGSAAAAAAAQSTPQGVGLQTSDISLQH